MVARPIVRVLLAIAASGVIAACQLGELVIPRADALVVVQAVLNPSDTDQLVLVEQTLTGDTNVISEGRYDPTNPIATDNGVPISGATVTITDPNGVVLRGVEDLTAQKQGTGVYRISLATAGVALIPGGVYALYVRVPTGQVVTGSTRIPDLGPGPTLAVVPFNRDHDTLQLSWPPTAEARAYTVVVQSPYQELYSFLDSDVVHFPGMIRNIEDEYLRALFFPGFLQAVTVAAVDTNLYDYYRTYDDPFTGSGLINHLTGGIGVFGSAVILSTRTLDVTADPHDTIEGSYVLATGTVTAKTPASQLRLYVESSGADGDALSGSYMSPASGKSRQGFVGTRSGQHGGPAVRPGQFNGEHLGNVPRNASERLDRRRIHGGQRCHGRVHALGAVVRPLAFASEPRRIRPRRLDRSAERCALRSRSPRSDAPEPHRQRSAPPSARASQSAPESSRPGDPRSGMPGK